MPTPMTMPRFGFLAFAIAITLAACGCTADAPEGTTTVQSKDGKVLATGTQGGQNARFLEYAPAYPGARVQSSVDMSMGGKKFHNINQHSADAPEKILAFYEEKAKAAGVTTQRMGGGLQFGPPGLGNMPAHSITATATATGTSIAMMLLSD
jgi:hypothetical protein